MTYLTKCHPDFHLPADVTVGKDFNAEAYVRKLKESNIDYVVFFGKCHYGFSYYPTKIGTIHPGLQTDMLGEIARECEKQEMGLGVYYSVFLDTAAVQKHPEWLLKADSKEIEGGFNSQKFQQVCVNSDYGDQLLIPQMLEILENYHTEEVFFDTMTGFIPCYCDSCRRKFGKPIPESQDDPNWLEYVNWYNQQYEDFFAKVIQIAYEHYPEKSVVFNWQWAARLPGNPAPHTKRLAGDLYPSGATSSYYSRYWAGTGLPFDYMCGRFMHGLSEWSNNTPETLKYTAASAIANGGSFYLIDRQLPDGSLEDRAWYMLNDVMGFVNQRRDVVTDTEHLTETAVLFSYQHIVGDKHQFFPEIDVRKERQRQYNAIANIFRNKGIHYTALNEDQLLNSIMKYKLVVLPEVDFMNAALKGKLKEFVIAGGSLLVVQSQEEPDNDILDMAGVRFVEKTSLNYGYIDFEKETFSDPVLVRYPISLVRTVEAETLNAYVMPLSEGGSGVQFGHGYAPPTKATEYAAVSCRKLGQGQIIYVSAPVLTSHEDYFNPHISNFIMGLVKKLLPEPLVKVQSKAQVEMVAVRKQDDLIIHLINHSGKEVLAGWWCPVVEYIPEVSDIEVFIHTSTDADVISFPDKEVLAAERQGSYLKVSIPKLKIMESLKLKDFFKN